MINCSIEIVGTWRQTQATFSRNKTYRKINVVEKGTNFVRNVDKIDSTGSGAAGKS